MQRLGATLKRVFTCCLSGEDRDFNLAARRGMWSNSFTGKKTVGQGALNIALLSTNCVQLKNLFDMPDYSRNELFTPVVALITLSICMQTIGAILTALLGTRRLQVARDDDSEMVLMKKKETNRSTETMNDISLILSILITVVNVIVSCLSNEATVVPLLQAVGHTPAP